MRFFGAWVRRVVKILVVSLMNLSAYAHASLWTEQSDVETITVRACMTAGGYSAHIKRTEAVNLSPVLKIIGSVLSTMAAIIWLYGAIAHSDCLHIWRFLPNLI